MPKPERLARIMGHKKHRLALKNLGGKLLHLCSRAGVQRRKRLVQKGNRPIFHERARKRHPLAHSARKRIGRLVTIRPKTDPIDHRLGPRHIGHLAPQPRPKHRIFAHGEPRKQKVRLRHETDPPGNRARIRRDNLTLELSGTLQPRNQAQERRLADPRRPEHTSPPPRRKPDINHPEQRLTRHHVTAPDPDIGRHIAHAPRSPISQNPTSSLVAVVNRA